jgi:hypothetical protein
MTKRESIAWAYAIEGRLYNVGILTVPILLKNIVILNTILVKRFHTAIRKSLIDAINQYGHTRVWIAECTRSMTKEQAHLIHEHLRWIAESLKELRKDNEEIDEVGALSQPARINYNNIVGQREIAMPALDEITGRYQLQPRTTTALHRNMNVGFEMAMSNTKSPAGRDRVARHQPVQVDRKTWLGDTGALCHLTNSLNGMYNLQPIECNIKVGSGTSLSATYIGKKQVSAIQRDGRTQV